MGRGPHRMRRGSGGRGSEGGIKPSDLKALETIKIPAVLKGDVTDFVKRRKETIRYEAKPPRKVARKLRVDLVDIRAKANELRKEQAALNKRIRQFVAPAAKALEKEHGRLDKEYNTGRIARSDVDWIEAQSERIDGMLNILSDLAAPL